MRWPKFLRPALAVLLFSATGHAARRTMVVAAGQCDGADVVEGAKLLTNSLKSRIGDGVADLSQWTNLLGRGPSTSLGQLKEWLDSIQLDYNQAAYGSALAKATRLLDDVQWLPPSPERWNIHARALRLMAQIQLALKRKKEAMESLGRIFRSSPDYPVPGENEAPAHFRTLFEKIQQGEDDRKPVALKVLSRPSGAQVWLDGNPLGKTPFEQDVTPGTYQLLLGSPDAYSLPHVLHLESNTRVDIDWAFERLIDLKHPPCVQEGEGKRSAEVFQKLGKALQVDELIVVRTEWHQIGPSWLTATRLQVSPYKKVSSAGMRMDKGQPVLQLNDLADFLVTGKTSSTRVVPRSLETERP